MRVERLGIGVVAAPVERRAHGPRRAGQGGERRRAGDEVAAPQGYQAPVSGTRPAASMPAMIRTSGHMWGPGGEEAVSRYVYY